MNVAVYGATGHTARFIIDELLRRGHTPIAIGRDAARTAAAVAAYDPAIETWAAALDAPEALDRALAGADAVINCAGPFLDTAQPLIEAALRMGVHYVDLTAEQGSARATLERYDDPAQERGIFVTPAAGFYGGLADLLATAAMGDWEHAESIDVAIALDRWLPTLGTRRTGERNTAARLAFSNGEFVELQPSAPAKRHFDGSFGMQELVEIPFTETILMAHHLPVREIHNYLNTTALHDVRDAATPTPVAADERGRSSQRFLMEVSVRRGDDVRRLRAEGQDIYAITAPIVVEALERIARSTPHIAGARALGQLDDTMEILRNLQRSGDLLLAAT